MRSTLLAAPLVAAAIVVSSPLPAQEIQVNQRLTAPTAQADTYAGVTLGRLILALGLSLQGLPPNLKGEELKSRLQALAEPERRPSRSKPAPAPLLAAQPVVPAVAAAAVPAAVQAVPAVVQTEALPTK